MNHFGDTEMKCCCGSNGSNAGWISLVTSVLTASTMMCVAVAQKTSSSTIEAPVNFESVSTLDETKSQRNRDSFEQVWQTVRDRHWDVTLNGVDWQKAHDELLPKAEKATDEAELNGVLNELLGRLNQSHFGVIPSAAYASIDGSLAGGDGTIGVQLRVIDGKPIVWRLSDGCSAEQAGVKPGWILDQIGQTDVQPLLVKTLETKDAKIDSSLLANLLINRKMQGVIGKEQRFQWKDGSGQSIETKLLYRTPAGKEARFGNMPATHVECGVRMIAEDVPCFSLNTFFDPPYVLSIFEKMIDENQEAPGIVIDLRGNPGGIGAMSMSIGGWLVSDKSSFLGTMTTRQGSLRFTLLPRDVIFSGKVAVLVDELSMSTSEILAGGLHDIHRARIFGTKTPGMALPSNFERLPYGSGFQYAFANYESANGKALESNGVKPDESITLTRRALLDGRDEVIDAAVRWIHSED